MKQLLAASEEAANRRAAEIDAFLIGERMPTGMQTGFWRI